MIITYNLIRSFITLTLASRKRLPLDFDNSELAVHYPRPDARCHCSYGIASLSYLLHCSNLASLEAMEMVA